MLLYLALLIAVATKLGGWNKVGVFFMLYYTWVKFSKAPHTGNSKLDFFRNSMFLRLAASYFPHKLVVTDKLPKKRYEFCVHPHGILALSASQAFGGNANNFDSLFPHLDIRVAVINVAFLIPVTREIALTTGCITASRSAMLDNLRRGRSIACVVGGADEALLAGAESMRLVLQDRCGFVRLAVMTGTDLVPVLAFGENQLFDQIFSKRLRRFQMLLQKFLRFSTPFFYGKWFVILPSRLPLTTVIGQGLEVPQVDEDDPRFLEVVTEVHAKYIEALKSLHAKYAPIYGSKTDQKLEILTVAEARNPDLAQTIQHQLQLARSTAAS